MKFAITKQRQSKIDWLLANPLVWQGYPSQAINDEKVFKALCDAGLAKPIAIVKHNGAINSEIGGLINEARRQRRMRKAEVAGYGSHVTFRNGSARLYRAA